MGKKLYVGNLPYSFDVIRLETLFSTVGKVVSANVIIDKDTGRSRGFGFVEMENVSAVQQAIKQLNETIQDDRTLIVKEARPLDKRSNLSI